MKRRASACVVTLAGKIAGSAFSRRARACRFRSSRHSDIFIGAAKIPARRLLPRRSKLSLAVGGVLYRDGVPRTLAAAAARLEDMRNGPAKQPQMELRDAPLELNRPGALEC